MKNAIVDPNNSGGSIAIIGSGTFTGEWTDILQYAALSVNGTASAAATLSVEFSDDASTIRRTVQESSGEDGTLGIHGLIRVSRYYRVTVANQTVGAITVYLESILAPTALIAQPTSRMGQELGIFSDVMNTRAALVGQDPVGDFTNIKADGLGFKTYALLGNGITYDSTILDLQSYTQVQTHILSDVNGTIQIDFIRDSAGTDVLRSLVIPYTGGSGFQAFSAPAFTPFVRYRFTADEAGQSDFYFDTKFLTKSLSGQLLGVDAFISPLMVANLGRNVLVGKTSGGSYNNVAIEPVTNNLNVALPRAAFGEVAVINPTPVVQVDFIYNINADMVDSTVTGSGTITQSDSMVILSTTAASSSSATVETKRYIKYRPGQGAVIRGTALYSSGVANSEQLFGCGDEDDGLFFGYDGADFGVMSRVDGVDTWVSKSSWNGDVMDGSGGASNPTGQDLDPTKGNVYQIRFQWLGFGRIEFGIEDSTTGRFVSVHSIRYANNFETPSMLNPSFPVMWSVKNTSNSTNVQIKGSSACAEIEGKVEYLGPTNATGNTKTGVTVTPTNIITIRNKSTYQSITNRTPVNILKYSASVDGNKPAEFQLVKNGTLGGTPAYTDISTNTSVMEYDTAGTTISGGQVIDFATLASLGSISESGTSTTDIILLPGETLSLMVAATQATTDATAAIRWVEDF